MSASKQPVNRRSLQHLLLRRFAMAVATYGIAMTLFWLAVSFDLLPAPQNVALVSSVLVVLSQLLFFALLRSDYNLRFRDPSMTEAQVLVGCSWLTYLLALLDSGRGTLLMFYVLILLFGLFHLSRRAFIRCALLVFFSFCTITLWDAYQFRLREPALAALQVCILAMVLAWLVIYARFVQVSRQRMRQRRFALQAHQDTLRGMMRQLESLAATDELTGLFNRRHFLALAANELAMLAPGQVHGLALIDLDHFKQVNDSYGHAVGDRVLQTFAAVARACLRDGDILARYGGEEFVLLLPDTSIDQFSACCERLREAFAAAEPVGVHVKGISLSAGMTLLHCDDELDDALQRADQALYRAKRDGRNRCAAAWQASDA